MSDQNQYTEDNIRPLAEINMQIKSVLVKDEDAEVIILSVGAEADIT